jgi:hypothetical protein
VKGPTREWVTFDDPVEEGRVWQIDVTFLLSSWQCIYGCGCQGNLTEPAPELELGCCSYGAHFSDKQDRDHVVKVARKLDESVWQFAKIGRKKGIDAVVGKNEDGTPDWRTRLVDDACIFLNRVGFANGPGCALHQYAMQTGKHHSEVKPEVCWQLPLRRIDDAQDDGTVISRLTEFGREGWGDGGVDFGWWCTEEPAAFTGSEPVYVSLAPELRTMLGAKLYPRVAAYLDAQRTARPAPVPHPAQQPVTMRATRRRKA